MSLRAGWVVKDGVAKRLRTGYQDLGKEVRRAIASFDTFHEPFDRYLEGRLRAACTGLSTQNPESLALAGPE